MLGPLFFVYKGFLVKFSCLKKKKYDIKKNPKKSERKFEKCFEAKKMHKGNISGHRKNVN